MYVSLLFRATPIVMSTNVLNLIQEQVVSSVKSDHRIKIRHYPLIETDSLETRPSELNCDWGRSH